MTLELYLYGVIAVTLLAFSSAFYAAIHWFGQKNRFYDRQYGTYRLFDCGDLGRARLTYLYDEDSRSPALKMSLYPPHQTMRVAKWTFPATVEGEQEAYSELMMATDFSITEEAVAMMQS